MSNPRTPLDDTGVFRAEHRPQGLRRLLESILHVSRELLARSRESLRFENRPVEALGELCGQLLNHRGEALGLALADEVLCGYQALSSTERLEFFGLLAKQFEADRQRIIDTAAAYRNDPNVETLAALAGAVEAPRQNLFRRLNMVPDGTRRLVALRGDLLDAVNEHPDLVAVESDLRRLLIAWFNRGFLVMEQIDWASPANMLEKIIEYEAVHEINGWDDLRVRLADDRRCFAFFHPAMPDDPLIFVEVALTSGMADGIEPLISRDRVIRDPRATDTAVFYSISNCHDGLRGISFGHFLIKQVIDELRRDLDNIEQFVTLSPVPGFCQWLNGSALETLPGNVQEHIRAARELLRRPEPFAPERASDEARERLMGLCAHYLLHEKRDGQPLDPVARFHLSNGASLQELNWAADCTTTGIERSAGIMVNYEYRSGDIERNHELYFAESKVTAAGAVRKLAP